MTAQGPDTTPVETLELDAVAILDDVVRRALAVGASDIHFEPKRDRLQIRFRIDGDMVEQGQVARELSTQVVSRVKVLARMDIAERRLPQDGQFTLDTAPSRVHLRASTFPCSQGEKVVLRILLGHSLIAFEKLGMTAEQAEQMRSIVGQPQGFVIAAGPTGAGKTSTLYAFLQLLDTASLNVVTLEDPIEVELVTITQGQTNVRAGFTFAAGLRAILRQDPDVILVGEMRDAETAGIALQAALTGHLVLSTVHTSDCIETIVRLVDLGVEPWIIASALSGIVAQRLVRMACRSCSYQKPLETDFWDGDELLMMAGTPTLHARGCRACNNTGYRGRTGIFEIVEIDDQLRDLVKAKAPVTAFRELMTRRKVLTLRRAGYQKIMQGMTTVAEVARVT